MRRRPITAGCNKSEGMLKIECHSRNSSQLSIYQNSTTVGLSSEVNYRAIKTMS